MILHYLHETSGTRPALDRIHRLCGNFYSAGRIGAASKAQAVALRFRHRPAAFFRQRAAPQSHLGGRGRAHDLLSGLSYPPTASGLGGRSAVVVAVDRGAHRSRNRRLLGAPAAHRVPFLWRFHAVHHASENGDWLAASHLHTFDQAIIRACAIIPLTRSVFRQRPSGSSSCVSESTRSLSTQIPVCVLVG